MLAAGENTMFYRRAHQLIFIVLLLNKPRKNDVTPASDDDKPNPAEGAMCGKIYF